MGVVACECVTSIISSRCFLSRSSAFAVSQTVFISYYQVEGEGYFLETLDDSRFENYKGKSVKVIDLPISAASWS